MAQYARKTKDMNILIMRTAMTLTSNLFHSRKHAHIAYKQQL